MAASTKIWVDNSAPQVNASDLNGFELENNNLILTSGQGLSISDNYQTTKAVALYSAGGSTFYTDSGSANTYILNAVGTFLPPIIYFDGLVIRFLVGTTNTGASVINVATLGVIPLVRVDGTPLQAGDITTGMYVEGFYLDLDSSIHLFYPPITPAVNGFTTGDRKNTYKAVADVGWVLMDDGTIGNASSGATTRADADTQDLFVLLWNNCADAQCPVSGGRGLSALADFSANKTINLPLVLGRVAGCAGSGFGLTTRALASVFGEETHLQTISEMPSHTHILPTPLCGGSGSLQFVAGAGLTAIVGATTAATGTGNPFNVMQPTEFSNVMIKL